jgi:hypothetical protein
MIIRGTAMFKPLALCFSFLFIPVAAIAQLQTQAPPTGFSGELVKYAEDSVTLKDKDGKEVIVAMTRGWTVSRPRGLVSSAIKAGDFIASANKVMDDHTGKSTELRILEPGYRPEYGTHLMAQADTAMTHGTVSTVSKAASGVELNVTYPGGSRQLIVPDDVKVTNYDLLDRSVLKPGMKVGAVARKDAAGVLRAGRLTLPPLGTERP